MKTIGPTVYIIVAYLILVTAVLPLYMRKRKEYDLKWLMFLYNSAATVLNVYIIARILIAKFVSKDFYFCTSIGTRNHDVSNVFIAILNQQHYL